MKTQTPQHIVITGATRGLGYAMAEECIRLGHFVSGCGRSEKQIQEMNKRFHGSACFTAVDICSAQAVRAWQKEIQKNNDSADIIINNAAIINNSEPFHLVETEAFDRLIDINVKGTANVLRIFIPPAIAAKKGLFINMSSGWGRFGAAEVAPYCASKGAVEMLSASIAQELPDGLAMMTLSPGGINTDMTLVCSGSHNEGALLPQEWASLVIPQILAFDTSLNGKVLSFDKKCTLRIG